MDSLRNALRKYLDVRVHRPKQMAEMTRGPRYLCNQKRSGAYYCKEKWMFSDEVTVGLLKPHLAEWATCGLNAFWPKPTYWKKKER